MRDRHYALIGFILGFSMTCLGLNPSWSQYADTYNEFLLYLCLGSIAIAFIKRGKKYDEITSVLFLLIGAFSVNSPIKIIENLHLVFTALAIISAYIGLINHSKNKIMKQSAYISFGVSILLFSFGYFFNWYSVAAAELLVSTPLIINFYDKKL